MPKSDQVVLRVGGECTGGVYQIEWPATVERIQGQWLWIVDRGGYRVPPVSGWVSKEEVQKLDESHDYYMRSLQTEDAPWLHWLMGIYLENKRESKAAQEEYLECLKVSPGSPDDAVRMAAENAPQLFDAAVRWARLKGTTAKSADEAVQAAGLLHDLGEIARQSGMRRPQLLFDQAEILRRAYHSAAAKERKKRLGNRRGHCQRQSGERPAIRRGPQLVQYAPTTSTNSWCPPIARAACRSQLVERLLGQGGAISRSRDNARR